MRANTAPPAQARLILECYDSAAVQHETKKLKMETGLDAGRARITLRIILNNGKTDSHSDSQRQCQYPRDATKCGVE